MFEVFWYDPRWERVYPNMFAHLGYEAEFEIEMKDRVADAG